MLAPSQEFEAVSNTPDPTGTYTVYSWNTTDAHVAGCPCFGDYDNLGADNNGIYVTTAELGIASGAANGVIVYAISKQQLEDGARVGVIPPVIGYRLISDPLGTPFVVAPTTTPPGTRYAPNTEYFVESDTTQLSDNGISHIADNIVLLQYVRDGPSMKRSLTIVKSRGSSAANVTREFRVATGGITLGEPIDSR